MSATTSQVGARCGASSRAACGQSPAWPGVSNQLSTLPAPSQLRCSLLVRLPRLRPMACAPFFWRPQPRVGARGCWSSRVAPGAGGRGEGAGCRPRASAPPALTPRCRASGQSARTPGANALHGAAGPASPHPCARARVRPQQTRACRALLYRGSWLGLAAKATTPPTSNLSVTSGLHSYPKVPNQLRTRPSLISSLLRCRLTSSYWTG